MDPNTETVVSRTVLRWGVAIDEIKGLNRRFVASTGESIKFTNFFEDACTWSAPETAQSVARRIRPALGEFVAVILVEEQRYNG